jgi:hypothetical protein
VKFSKDLKSSSHCQHQSFVARPFPPYVVCVCLFVCLFVRSFLRSYVRSSCVRQRHKMVPPLLWDERCDGREDQSSTIVVSLSLLAGKSEFHGCIYMPTSIPLLCVRQGKARQASCKVASSVPSTPSNATTPIISKMIRGLNDIYGFVSCTPIICSNERFSLFCMSIR